MAGDLVSLGVDCNTAANFTKCFNFIGLGISNRYCSYSAFILGDRPCWLSLLFDGIDGSVAIFQRRESAWGATLDSVADRISEAAWAYALYQVGIPLEIAVGLWLAASVQEYARARLSALGVKDLGIVTFAERPMRASLLFLILIAWQLELTGLAIIAGAFLLMQVIGALQVMRFGYQQLR